MSASYAEVDRASASSRAAAGVPAAAGWRQRALLSSCVSWLICGLQDVVSVGCQTSRPWLRHQSNWRASVVFCSSGPVHCLLFCLASNMLGSDAVFNTHTTRCWTSDQRCRCFGLCCFPQGHWTAGQYVWLDVRERLPFGICCSGGLGISSLASTRQLIW